MKGLITVKGNIRSESVIFGNIRYKYTEGKPYIEQYDTATWKMEKMDVLNTFTMADFRTFCKGVAKANPATI